MLQDQKKKISDLERELRAANNHI